MSLLGRMLAVVVLAVATLGFGAMGLCGGVWSVAAIPAMFMSGGMGTIALLLLSLPCAFGGFYMAKLCARKLQRLTRKSPTTEESP